MGVRGFALTELVVVIAIIGILAAIVTINFSSWQRKYSIEGQTKELLTDLSDARLLAIQTKKEHQLTLNPTSMVFRRYSSESDATGTQVLSKNLKYPIQQFSSGTLSAFSNTIITINTRGYTSDLMTIAVGAGMGGSPAYDCLAVHRARVNMGRINGNSCDFQ
jgi:prepilin-type N-terminal cleavage/methylation domain-containing protein